VRTIDEGQTVVIANSKALPTAGFQFNSNALPDEHSMAARFEDLAGKQNTFFVDGTGLALSLLGDTIASNLFVVGYALQLGFLPVSAAAVERAIEINGASVDMNLKAFRYGRAWALDSALLEDMLESTRAPFKPLDSLEEIVAHRTELLGEYQNEAYTRRYRDLVDAVKAAETRTVPGSQRLSIAVARNFAKLMAYKDEYEVGRLYSRPEFLASVKSQFEGDYQVRFNLAPPLFAKRDKVNGNLLKREYGPWMIHAMRLLGRLRFLRHTPFDVFGYSRERKMERQLITDYEARIRAALPLLTASNLPMLVALAVVPEMIKGFGHIKEANVALAKKRDCEVWETLLRPASEKALPEARVSRALAE
jgi:indolepyruvate ferredoxin oxidoreductase